MTLDWVALSGRSLSVCFGASGCSGGKVKEPEGQALLRSSLELPDGATPGQQMTALISGTATVQILHLIPCISLFFSRSLDCKISVACQTYLPRTSVCSRCSRWRVVVKLQRKVECEASSLGFPLARGQKTLVCIRQAKKKQPLVHCKRFKGYQCQGHDSCFRTYILVPLRCECGPGRQIPVVDVSQNSSARASCSLMSQSGFSMIFRKLRMPRFTKRPTHRPAAPRPPLPVPVPSPQLQEVQY